MDRRQRAGEMRKRRHFLVAAHLREDLLIVRRCGRVIPDYRIIGRFIGRDKGLQINISVDDFPNDGLRRNMERDVAGVLGSIQHGVADCIPLCTGKEVVLDGVVRFAAMCVKIFGLDAVCDLPVDCGRRPRLHIDGAKPLAGVVLIPRMFRPGKLPGADCGRRKQRGAIHTNDLHRCFDLSFLIFRTCFLGNCFTFACRDCWRTAYTGGIGDGGGHAAGRGRAARNSAAGG